MPPHPPDAGALYRVLAESAPDAIITIDESSTILGVNPAAERIFGYAAAEMVGQSLHMLMPPRMRPRHDAGLARYVATGQRHITWRGAPLPILTKAGVEIPAEISFGEFVTDGRRLFAGFVRDVSERVASQRALAESHARLQEQAVELETQVEAAHLLAGELEAQVETAQQLATELEEARAVAEGANRAKDLFLATMSHELRTPLNAIGGYAELLEMGLRGPLTDAQREDLARIRRSQHHLLALVNDVLDLARLESGATDFRIADVPLHEALRDLEALVRPQVDAKGLTLESCHPDPALVVRADADRLTQIFVNLLSNSIKFTPEGGRVTIDCTVDGGVVRIRVTDTGVGIPADQLERIFEPFTQVQEGFTRPVEGTGLGLSISRDLARAMDGDLRAEHLPDGGARLILTLPRGTPPLARDGRAAAAVRR